MCVINDPLSQTHSPASSNHYAHLKFILFCEILKSGDGRTVGLAEGIIDDTCPVSFVYRFFVTEHRVVIDQRDLLQGCLDRPLREHSGFG